MKKSGALHSNARPAAQGGAQSGLGPQKEDCADCANGVYKHMEPPPVTVAETGAFISQAKGVLNDTEREALINEIAADPACGNVIPGTGGVRKFRWALGGRGKRGGARVIYYYHSGVMPVYLMAVFSKREKADLTKAECNDLRKFSVMLTDAWRKRIGK